MYAGQDPRGPRRSGATASRKGLVIALVLAVLAFSCTFAGVTAGLGITQPAKSGSVATMQFVVRTGDSATQVGDRLQSAGLIQNALAFRLLARVRKLVVKAGVYQLSPGMTMDEIIAQLNNGQPGKELTILVPPGMRVLQYPAAFKDLPDFDGANFIKIVTTGKYADGTLVSSKFWFVRPIQPNVRYALEGYLFPDTYDFFLDATETTVVNTLLDGLGEKLCPGPASQPDAYLADEAQCKAHAVTLAGGATIFAAMEQAYSTTDDVAALYDTLTVASIVMREVSKSPGDIVKVTDVYYNRWLEAAGKLPQPVDPGQPGGTDVVDFLGADPTAQYARDTDNPPANGVYWSQLQGSASQTDPDNLYNTANATHKGLPPGPISAPFWLHIAAAAQPNASGPTPNFYFLSTCQNGANVELYASTYTQFEQLISKNPPPC